MFTITVKQDECTVMELALLDVGDPKDGNYALRQTTGLNHYLIGNFHHAFNAPLLLLAGKAIKVFEDNLPPALLARDPDRIKVKATCPV